MAGAVGVPTALLLPIAADWRWLRAGTDSLWYQSVSLVRQLRFGDWTDVLDNAARWLRGRGGGGGAMLDQSGTDL